MTIAVLTNDKYLFRRIQLEVGADTVPYSDGIFAHVLIVDCDFADAPDFSGRVILLSRSERAEAIKLPLPIGAFAELCSEENVSRQRLTVSEKEKCAHLDSKKIKLTAHELSLLSLLISRGGAYVGRKEISDTVFGGASDGLINIYIHYLREKLELDGEKIIISSRSNGYKINEKYIGGAVC